MNSYRVPHLDLMIRRILHLDFQKDPDFHDDVKGEYLNPAEAIALWINKMRKNRRGVKKQNISLGNMIAKYMRSYLLIKEENKIVLKEYLEKAHLLGYYQDFISDLEKLLGKSYKDYIRVKMFIPKFTIGLGDEGVYEIGLTVHHTFGIPYIPGTAIKGVFRRIFKIILNNDNLVDGIFGPEQLESGKECAGSVDFTDALPIVDNTCAIYPDVLTRHIDPKKPNETDDPRPVTFLAISNMRALFYVIPTGRKNSHNHLETIYNVLSNLKGKEIYFGIGAKTSAGYGVFRIEECVKGNP